MKSYYEYSGIVIYHGDCLGIMDAMEPESVGVVFTDNQRLGKESKQK